MTNPFKSKKGVVHVSMFDSNEPDDDLRSPEWQKGFLLSWVAGCGFGMLGVTFHADDRITIDTECMGRRFASAVFRYILANAEYDVPAEHDEPLDESWQPLTPDTVLPESGYLVLYDSHTEDCHTWRLPLIDCSVADFSPVYTHYRVVRGPEAT